MAWEEWEQLKSAAAERHSAQMQLNGTQVSGQVGGGEVGGLKHTDKPWTHAADVANDLTTGAATDMRDLTRAHEGLAGATVGLTCVATLSSVLTSWDARLSALREECGTLQPALRQVAVDLGEADAKVKQEADAIRVPGTKQGA
ncbi:amino acid ABC transporter permease [Streptomyces violascens]|uniref:amino acid ABC transporter permease n=1 Tax=Streptomyces violascens TaxID=67381 RepID=UPI0036996217